MKKVTFCLILLLALLCLLHAQADTVTFESVSQATGYVRKNQPMNLTLKDVRFRPSELYTVYNAMPAGSEFHFSTTWGKIPFTDEAVDLDLREIKTNVTQDDLEALIAICPNIRRIDNTGKRTPSNDVMIPLMEKYPDVQFEWVVRLGGTHYCPTTATAFSTFNEPLGDNTLSSKQLERLQYCPRLKALDLGHNMITTLDFLRFVPDLELLIIGDNLVKDITPIGELKHLQYAELFSNEFTDLTPLANCTELLDLNICYCPVLDFSPIDDLPNLERFWATMIRHLSQEEMDRFQRVHPDVEVDFTGSHATTNGWRKHPRYTHYIWCLRNGTWIPFDEPIPEGVTVYGP